MISGQFLFAFLIINSEETGHETAVIFRWERSIAVFRAGYTCMKIHVGMIRDDGRNMGLI